MKENLKKKNYLTVYLLFRKSPRSEMYKKYPTHGDSDSDCYYDDYRDCSRGQNAPNNGVTGKLDGRMNMELNFPRNQARPSSCGGGCSSVCGPCDPTGNYGCGSDDELPRNGVMWAECDQIYEYPKESTNHVDARTREEVCVCGIFLKFCFTYFGTFKI